MVRDGLPSLQHADASIQALVEMLRACLNASACLIAIGDFGSKDGCLYRAPRADEGDAATRRTADKVTQSLLALPGQPVLYDRQARRGGPDRASAAVLADLLEMDSFICVPLRTASLKGRLCIAREQGRSTAQERRSMEQIARAASIVIEAVHRGQRLAVASAQQERRQISRDLHDSAIQPYIGLKLGLEALRRRAGSDHKFASEVDELINIAADGIGELRQYAGGLKALAATKKADCLLSAVRAQARKFSAFYGIEATVVAADDIPVTAPMQHEIVQIVREGLSNIRRHTFAERATIRLHERRGKLLVELINDKADCRSRQPDFFPRSIGERASELGGRVRVGRRDGSRTVVAVELPL
jgi:signal transduction histidine kinase